MIVIAVLQSLGIHSFCSKNTAFYHKCFETESYLYRSTFATLICKHCEVLKTIMVQIHEYCWMQYVESGSMSP